MVPLGIWVLASLEPGAEALSGDAGGNKQGGENR